MNNELKIAIKKELHSGSIFLKSGQTQKAFYHLQRAHILGQTNPYFHTLSHLYMFYAAIIDKNIKEMIGQLFRIPTGFIGSIFGIVPIGNTGRSNVNAFKSMPIPSDLQRLIDSTKGSTL